MYRVVLPKSGVTFRQQFNGDMIYSLDTLYKLVQHRMNILVNYYSLFHILSFLLLYLNVTTSPILNKD